MDLQNILTVEMVMMAIVLIIIVTASIVILIRMKPLKDFDQIKMGKLELKRSGADVERDKQQDEALNKLLTLTDELKNRLDDMHTRIDGMGKRLDIQYTFIKKAAVAANQGVLWGDKSPPFQEVINGGLMLIMLGQNGNVVTRMRECIMGFGIMGVETYQSELNKFRNEYKEKLDAHFEQQIEAIKKGIY